MQDYSLAAVDRTLTSVIIVLGAAIKRAETLADQRLCDDLWLVMAHLKRISAGIGPKGQVYRPK